MAGAMVRYPNVLKPGEVKSALTDVDVIFVGG